MRLAYLLTHPTQYQAPLLRRIAAEPDIQLKVFFASDVSVGTFVDPGFKRSIQWDTPLLDGYDYEFLPSIGSRERISFWKPINYGLASKLRTGRFDALWIHGYMRWHHWTAMATAKRLGVKVLVRDEANIASRFRGKGRLIVKRWFFAGLSKVTDSFLAVGTRSRNYYLHYGVEDT